MKEINMPLETLSKEAQQAIEHFESKLNFEVGPIGLDRMIKSGQPVQIIDLRTKELYDKGHVPGAINIAYEELEKSLGKFKPDVPTVVYCYDIVCSLSTKAALDLAKKGYKVKELVGGFEEWANHSLANETGTKSSCSTSGHSCG
jgi:rhodanese-related sulfurtransferase